MKTQTSSADLEAEVRAALERGADHRSLLETVGRYKDRGVTQREAYDALERIRLGFGFNDDEGDAPNRLRDELEFTMEVVWDFCSGGQRIRETSLTNNSYGP